MALVLLPPLLSPPFEINHDESLRGVPSVASGLGNVCAACVAAVRDRTVSVTFTLK
jgi:hypothetical protein